jgi:hypothetical protein
MKIPLASAFIVCIQLASVSFAQAQFDTSRSETRAPVSMWRLVPEQGYRAIRPEILDGFDSLLYTNPQLRSAFLRYILSTPPARFFDDPAGDSPSARGGMQLTLTPFEWMSQAGKRRQEYFGQTPLYGMMGQLSVRGFIEWLAGQIP